MPDKPSSIPKLIVILAVMVGLMTIFVLTVGDPFAIAARDTELNGQYLMNDIERQVALDAERQYGIASRSGSAMDACVQAGMVAAAHLQAKNEAAYAQWKRTEAKDCRAAGLR